MTTTLTRAAASLDIRPLAGSLGAEIHGVDLAHDADTAVWSALAQAIADYGVIFFRDQNLTPEQHIAMAERFAPINVNRFFTPVAGHPQIAEVRKEPDQKRISAAAGTRITATTQRQPSARFS